MVVLVVFALSSCSGTPSGFPSGKGTATITWHYQGGTAPATYAYEGKIAGVPVSGSAIVPAQNSTTGGTPTPSLVLARWSGEFEGTTFNLKVSESTEQPADQSSLVLTIDGTYGTQEVRATATIPRAHSDGIPFEGSIGPHKVTGTIYLVEHESQDKAVVDFTVSD